MLFHGIYTIESKQNKDWTKSAFVSKRSSKCENRSLYSLLALEICTEASERCWKLCWEHTRWCDVVPIPPHAVDLSPAAPTWEPACELTHPQDWSLLGTLASLYGGLQSARHPLHQEGEETIQQTFNKQSIGRPESFMGCKRILTRSAPRFVRADVLSPAGDASLCLCVHPAFFNMYKHTLVSYRHSLALRVLMTDVPVPVTSSHRCFYFRKTPLLQRELKASHNFPVTNHTPSKSTLIVEISTTTPAYPQQRYVWPEVLLLDPSFLFSFYLSGSQPFIFSSAFYLSLDHQFPCYTKDAEAG